MIDGDMEDCWKMKSDLPENWTCDTRWPKSAIEILEKSKQDLQEKSSLKREDSRNIDILKQTSQSGV